MGSKLDLSMRNFALAGVTSYCMLCEFTQADVLLGDSTFLSPHDFYQVISVGYQLHHRLIVKARNGYATNRDS